MNTLGAVPSLVVGSSLHQAVGTLPMIVTGQPTKCFYCMGNLGNLCCAESLLMMGTFMASFSERKMFALSEHSHVFVIDTDGIVQLFATILVSIYSLFPTTISDCYDNNTLAVFPGLPTVQFVFAYYVNNE